MTGWMLSDGLLYRVLFQYLVWLYGKPDWILDLYTNPRLPQPGDVLGDYIQPTLTQWPGYIGQFVPTTSWQAVQVVAHVAQSFQPMAFTFVLPTGNTPVTIYGYTVSDSAGALVYAEEFRTAQLVPSPGQIQIQPFLNLGIYPPP